MEYQEEYKRKLVSVEEAAKVIQSGDKVFMGPVEDARAVAAAICARRSELKNVRLVLQCPTTPLDWYLPGWEDSFALTFQNYTGPVVRPVTDEKRADYIPLLLYLQHRRYEEGPLADLDVYLVRVSPPDRHGFCSFGCGLWNKKSYCRRAKKVIAEVDENMIRTGGDNFIHVSEIDYFVEYTPSRILLHEIPEAVAKAPPETRDLIARMLRSAQPDHRPAILDSFLTMRPEEIKESGSFMGMIPEPTDVERAVAEHVKPLIKDGDAVEIGFGVPSGTLAGLGVFDNRTDLTLWSEMMEPGVGKLIEAGVFNGRNNPFHPGKAIVTACLGLREDEVPVIDGNPKVESYESIYVLNPKRMGSIDNLVAINNALCIDLTGQIDSETVFGPRLINGLGGQPESVLGAMLSNGGRSIHCLPSTAMHGTLSRIVPQLEQGSLVTVPRYHADYVVSEYGVASLFGKSIRQRADALIEIAHPDFRAELRKAAKKLFYP